MAKKIKVKVQWCENNFGATVCDIPGSVVVTAKTYAELVQKVPEAVIFHVEGMVAAGDHIPKWLKDGGYEFSFILVDEATRAKYVEEHLSRKTKKGLY